MVAKALQQALHLDRDLREDEIPVVAVMATGGGIRAMTSLYGQLAGLKALGLLDCVSYITGASGSTWALANLYEDPEWSQKDLAGPIESLKTQVAKSKLGVLAPRQLLRYQQELAERARLGHPACFTNLWALINEALLHDEPHDHKLSDQREALSRGQNPLPIYCALNTKEQNLTTFEFGEWCEFSPYEVGFPKYGAFIPSELFGSEFFMGRLMKRLPESRICFLEGIWSNIFSLNLLDAWYDLTSSDDTWKQHIRDKIRDLEVSPASAGTSSWPETLWMQPGTALAQMFKGLLTSRPLYQHSSNFLQGLQMHKDYCAQKDFTTWADCRPDSSPNQLTPQEPQLCLVDAGYFINTSCPVMFRPGRRLDLIISFDYSLSSPFEVLQQTELDFRARGLPFPRVEPSPKDRRQPRECHLFSDPACPDAPVVLHFPLVNASFKDHSAPGVQRGPEELSAGQIDLTGVTSPYSTFNMTYKEEDFDRLVQLSDYNVRSSQDTILQALRTVLKHRAPEARPPRVQT